jgi:hypothetical protein
MGALGVNSGLGSRLGKGNALGPVPRFITLGAPTSQVSAPLECWCLANRMNLGTETTDDRNRPQTQTSGVMN